MQCHVARNSMAWLASQNMQTMNWPPYSPDLNPIKNIWGILTNKVYGDRKQYNSIPELKAAVLSALSDLSLEVLQNLCQCPKGFSKLFWLKAAILNINVTFYKFISCASNKYILLKNLPL